MPDNFRTMVVVNPAGAGGKVGRRWPDIRAHMRREFGPFEDALTSGPGDATALTRQALRSGFEQVVALGGDGTVNEVVNGFFDGPGGDPIRPDGVLAVLPMGTGGDFRRSLGLGVDLADNVQRLKGRDSRPFDVGRATTVNEDGYERIRYFANIASFGSSGEIVRNANAGSKALGGKATFFLSTVKTLFTYDNPRVRLTLDGGEPFDVLTNTVAIANAQFFGGGMHIAPTARHDDGLFEVVVIGDAGLGFFVRHQSALYRGEHLDLPVVRHLQARVVRAEALSDEGVLAELDGEGGAHLPATFEVLPSVIRIHT